ncbi:MAG: hypothetical protein ACOH1Y_01705 [Propionicimonas sp.]
MGSLLQPVGAQPARVYWARRAVVVIALVVLLVAVFWLFRPADGGNVSAVPASTMTTPSQSATPSGTPSATESATPTPTGPLVCDQTNSGLALAGYQKVKQDAKQPFKVALTNTGGAACVLDLTPAKFSLTVTSGTDRIWTTDDCAKWVPAKKQTLKPQKAYEFTIEWGVNRSGAGCKLGKSLLNPGTYIATATFSDSVKARQVFVVTKA